MLNHKSITIGATAYNEELNIYSFIKAILRQKVAKYKIEKIIIACDGCTDNTIPIINKIDDPRIEIISSTVNMGKVVMVNQILRKTKSDYLVLFDSDVELFSNYSVLQLVAPLDEHNVAITSGRQIPILGNTLAEKIAYAGYLVWENAKKMVGSPSVYHCSGGNRAFSKKFYTQLNFPSIMAEDIYPYLFADSQGLKFLSVDSPIIRYRLPKTLSDYIKRDKRYSLSPIQHSKLFGKKYVESHFKINNKIRVRATLQALIVNPIYTTLYLIMAIIPRLLAIFDKDKYNSKWERISSAR